MVKIQYFNEENIMFLCFEIVIKVRWYTNRTNNSQDLRKVCGKKIGMERHKKSRLATNDSVKQGFKI